MSFDYWSNIYMKKKQEVASYIKARNSLSKPISQNGLLTAANSVASLLLQKNHNFVQSKTLGKKQMVNQLNNVSSKTSVCFIYKQ